MSYAQQLIAHDLRETLTLNPKYLIVTQHPDGTRIPVSHASIDWHNRTIVLHTREPAPQE